MKRCPQCLFIYPDTDLVCDFDQTPLVVATEAEIAAVTNTPEISGPATALVAHKNQSRKNWRGLLVSGAIGLLVGMVIVGVYFAVHRQMNPQPLPKKPDASSSSQPLIAPTPSPSASPMTAQVAASPEPIVAPTKTLSSKTATAHSSSSTGPVSTSTRGVGAKSGKSVILLTSGSKVEADEVWRTKDGIWYRRDGIVTLLKKTRVKAIVRQ
jgi:cytoskeletal protein RodZ